MNQVLRIFWDTFTSGTATVRVLNLDTASPEKQVLEVLKTRAPMARGFSRLAVANTVNDVAPMSYVEVTFHTEKPHA